MSDHNSSLEPSITRRQILVAAGTSGLLVVTGSWYALGQQPRRKDSDRDRPEKGGDRDRPKKGSDRDRPEKGRHGKVGVRSRANAPSSQVVVGQEVAI